MKKNIIKKIQEKFCKHNFEVWNVTVQALNTDGIAYEFRCTKCNIKKVVNLSHKVKIEEYMCDEEKKKALFRYIDNNGFRVK